MKIFSTLFRTKIQIIVFGIVFVSLIPIAQAEVFVPENEYIGFFDSNGVYTVVGNIKNNEAFPIIPTVTITIQDGKNILSEEFEYLNIMPSKEIPFKFHFPQITDDNPILHQAEISYIRGVYDPKTIEVIYDSSLIVHEDGHLTGRIINTGNETIFDIQIFAVIHGYNDETLDMGQNVFPIIEMKPGEIREFSMYPDPTIASQVWYYSCFAVGQDSIVVLNIPRNDDMFKIRYDSGILLAYPEFNLQGTNLSFNLIEGWPLQNYINLEFPRYSEDESFEVILNDEPVDSIQTIDNMGNWHVAFTIEPQTAGLAKITGFDPDGKLIETISIPNWIRNNADWWSKDKISDSDFVSGIEYMIKFGLISIPSIKQQTISTEIPEWIKNNAGWWSQELISDQEFVSGLQYMIANGIISL